MRIRDGGERRRYVGKGLIRSSRKVIKSLIYGIRGQAECKRWSVPGAGFCLCKFSYTGGESS